MVALAFAFGACSSTATLRRWNGPAYEAEIARSDGDAIYVRAEDGRTYRVPRAEIADVDHPGNVSLLVGAGLLAYTLLIVASIRSENTRDSDPTAAIIGTMFGVPGALLLGTGGYFYWTSTQNARAMDKAIAAPLVAPPPLPYAPPPLPYAPPAPSPTEVVPTLPSAPPEPPPDAGAAGP